MSSPYKQHYKISQIWSLAQELHVSRGGQKKREKKKDAIKLDHKKHFLNYKLNLEGQMTKRYLIKHFMQF